MGTCQSFLSALAALAQSCPALTLLHIEVADITDAEVSALEAQAASSSYRSRAAVEKLTLGRVDGTDPFLRLDASGFDRLARVLEVPYLSLSAGGLERGVWRGVRATHSWEEPARCLEPHSRGTRGPQNVYVHVW